MAWRPLALGAPGQPGPELRTTKVSDHDFDRLVRNVYKVLMTRGMRSVHLYSTDPTTRDFLRGLVGG